MRIPISLDSEHAWLKQPTEFPLLNGFLFLLGTLAPGALASLIYLIATVGFLGMFRFLAFDSPFGDPLTVRFGEIAFAGGAVWSAALWLRLGVRVRVGRLPAPFLYGACAGLFALAGALAPLVNHR